MAEQVHNGPMPMAFNASTAGHRGQRETRQLAELEPNTFRRCDAWRSQSTAVSRTESTA